MPKVGGRQKGGKNKTTRIRYAAIADSGLLPLDYMLSVMRSEAATQAERMDAAYKAAPYIHSRKASAEPATDDESATPVSVVTPQVRDATRSQS